MQALLKKTLANIVALYGAIVSLLWLLQWRVDEKIIGIGVAKSLLYLLLLPSLLLLPIALVMRRLWHALILLPSVVAFFISFGVYLLPRTKVAPPDLPNFRLLTFNLESPDEAAAAALVKIIAATDADIVAVQELTPAGAAAFEAHLREAYPHQALHPHPDYAGQGVLSRFAIEADDYWRYEELPGALGYQRVQIQIAGHPVVLYNVHPAPPVTYKQYLNAAAHRTSLDNLLENVAQETPHPVLMAGDFNMTDHFHSYRRITAHYTDAFRAVGKVGFGFTFPNKPDVPLPALLRLDYIFYDPAFTGIRAQVWPDSGPADHAPVLAHLAICDVTRVKKQ
jgi:endonuclease/exonuclease/phosphatase (EEP) superfamily protein YafD